MTNYNKLFDDYKVKAKKAGTAAKERNDSRNKIYKAICEDVMNKFDCSLEELPSYIDKISIDGSSENENQEIIQRLVEFASSLELKTSKNGNDYYASTDFSNFANFTKWVHDNFSPEY